MQPRINYLAVAPGAYKAMLAVEEYLLQSGLEGSLLHLIKLRTSQINGCAYCIDMHWKDLRSIGENEQRLYGLDAWRESPYYTERERAALAWTEAVTNIREGHTADEVYDQVQKHFSEKEVADLTLVVCDDQFLESSGNCCPDYSRNIPAGQGTHCEENCVIVTFRITAAARNIPCAPALGGLSLKK